MVGIGNALPEAHGREHCPQLVPLFVEAMGLLGDGDLLEETGH